MVFDKLNRETLYRVVIRDKNYWKGVDRQGGVDRFNARAFFRKNRIKIQVSNTLKKKSRSNSANSDKSSLISPKVQFGVKAVLEEDGKIKSEFIH